MFAGFISADRYPRVGILKTAAVAAIFSLIISWPKFHRHGFEDAIPGLLVSLIAVVISIQVLAPQHQELAHINESKKSETPPDPRNQPASDLELTNTKLDELEMQIIQQEGQ